MTYRTLWLSFFIMWASLAYTQTAGTGAITGTLTIKDGGTGSPAEVSLSGKGTSA